MIKIETEKEKNLKTQRAIAWLLFGLTITSCVVLLAGIICLWVL